MQKFSPTEVKNYESLMNQLYDTIVLEQQAGLLIQKQSTTFLQKKIKDVIKDFEKFSTTVPLSTGSSGEYTFITYDFWFLSCCYNYDFGSKSYSEFEERVNYRLLDQEYWFRHLYFTIEDFYLKLFSENRGYIENIRSYFSLPASWSENKILRHVESHYSRILNDELTQIEFPGIVLSKPVSDKVVRVLLNYFKYRISITEDFTTAKSIPSRPDFLIKWRGTQKELADLFIELENKGWISRLQYGERNTGAKAILKCFDISKTCKSSQTNTKNSFSAIFRGLRNKDGSIDFDRVHTPKYKFPFKGIDNCR